MKQGYLTFVILSWICLTVNSQEIDNLEGIDTASLEESNESLEIITQDDLDLNVTEIRPRQCSDKVHSHLGNVVEEKVSEVSTCNPTDFLVRLFLIPNTFLKLD